MGEPSGQLQSAANSAMLAKAPFVRNLNSYYNKMFLRKANHVKNVVYAYLSGEWGSVKIWFLRWGGLTASHLKNKHK
jgi:hypothetical protein